MDDAKRDTHAPMASGANPDGATTLDNGASPAVAGSNGSETASTVEETTAVQAATTQQLMGRPVRRDSQDGDDQTTPLAAVATPSDEEATTLVEPAPIEQTVLVEPAPAQEPEPGQGPEPVTKAKRGPIWRQLVSLIVGSRWIFAIPAVWITLSTGYAVEQARISVAGRPPAPPDNSWQQFALAGLLLVVAVFPKRLPAPEGLRAYLRNLRAKNIDTWLDLAVLISISALVAAGVVYAASGALPQLELVEWAITTWLWPFLESPRRTWTLR